MAAGVWRCLSVYSRPTCMSLLRPVTKVLSRTHVSVSVMSPITKGKWTTRWYSDEAFQFNEPSEGYRYAKSHEWASIDGDIAMIGVSNYAQEKLGDVVYVELPEIDQELEQFDTFSVLESVKAAADLQTPVGGKVVEVNNALEDTPDLVNKEPYGNGWVAKVKGFAKEEYEGLMSAEEYKKFLSEAV